jgi:hypothetical protein
VNYDREFVEMIVQEVLRRLTAGASSVPMAVSPPSARELVLQDRLITLATLDGRLEGVSRLVISRRAVISPSARDELRAKAIELKRE